MSSASFSASVTPLSDGRVRLTEDFATGEDVVTDLTVDELNARLADDPALAGILGFSSYSPSGPVGYQGPKSKEAGGDYDVAHQAFDGAGTTWPYNSNTTPGLENRLKHTPAWNGAVSELKSWIATSDSMYQTSFFQKLGGLPMNNIMESLPGIMAEATRQSQQDQRYFLQRIADLNKIAEKFAEIQGAFNEASKQLSGCEKGSDEPAKCTIGDNMEIQIPDPNGGLDEQGNPRILKTVNLAGMTRDTLNATQREFDAQREIIKQLQDEYKAKLQAAQQAGNGTMQILTTIVKEAAKNRDIGSNNMK